MRCWWSNLPSRWRATTRRSPAYCTPEHLPANSAKCTKPHIAESLFRRHLAGAQAARPGNTVGDVARAELAALEEMGWLKWHEYDLGHGDGLDHPQVPAITPASNIPIEPGMVLCIHPGLRGIPIPQPGVGGVFVGGTALVGEEETTPLHRVASTL